MGSQAWVWPLPFQVTEADSLSIIPFSLSSMFPAITEKSIPDGDGMNYVLLLILVLLDARCF